MKPLVTRFLVSTLLTIAILCINSIKTLAQNPIASAGANQTITLPTSSVTLMGASAFITPATAITAYKWKQTLGSIAVIQTPSAANTNITGLSTIGSYEFELTVTDDKGNNGSSKVTVTVVSPPLPIATAAISQAQLRQSTTLPTTSLTLAGTEAATAPGAVITSHKWSQAAGSPAVTIVNPDNLNSSVMGFKDAGTYIFNLTVTDTYKSTTTAQVTVTVDSALTYTYVNPSNFEDTPNGTITIHHLRALAIYKVEYSPTQNHAIDPFTITSDANGNLTIPNLGSGTYSNIITTDLSDGTQPTSNPNPTKITLDYPKIATQSTKFLGAAYGNFTGVPDDNLTGFTQVYARLSQPLPFKYNGINGDASFCRRIILLRNLMLQLTYGNTDNFKLYSYDSVNTNTRYVNRLDLLGHSFFNGNFSVNLLTFIMPKYWKTHTGDLGHIYLDFMTSLILTNVTDSTLNSTTTNKTYNVKSNLYGFNLKARFADISNSDFSIEAGAKVFWLYPSSASVNSNLNPQYTDIESLSTNSSKNLIARNKNVSRYYNVDFLVLYNTSSNDNNQSNIFLHFSYTSNYPSIVSPRYANNYFQFQLGYNLDISGLFPSAKSTSTKTAAVTTP